MNTTAPSPRAAKRTTKHFALCLLAIWIAPAVLTLAIATFTPLPRLPGELGIDQHLDFASAVAYFGSIACGLVLGFVVAFRTRNSNVVRIVIGVFLSALFFVASLALCLGGCNLGDALRG